MSFIRPVFILGVAVLGATSVAAQTQDLVKWRASVGTTNNDNFFNTTNAPVTEQVTTETLGVNLSVPYSLQRFELDASLVANQYKTYNNFDFVGQNFNGTWFWSFTPQLHGTLSSTRSETLNAPTDSLNPTQRNKSTVQNNALTAAYDLGGPWQLTAGALNNNVVNERAVIGQTDDHVTGVNAGVRYALGSGNSLAYFRQVTNGENGTKYVQTVDDAAVVWVLSGSSTLNAHAAYLRQQFDSASQYDFSGTTGGVNVVWQLTGKTSLTAGWQRDIASYQTLGASYTQTDTLSISPVWQISPITSVRAQYRDSVLTEQGSPFGTASGRRDHVQDSSLSFSWQPYQRVSLSATLGQITRSSNVVINEFTARTISLAAVFSF